MENSAKAPAIEARGLTRTFKGDVEAVRGVDVSVPQGEIFGFLGPNGAGKSTTIRMLCTLLPPTRGSALVAGHDVVDEGDQVRRNIGVALQEIGLDPVQTGRELLELQCGLYGITGSSGRERSAELLELVGLTDAQARAKPTDAGLQVGTADHAYSTKVAPNRVIDQNPAADEFVDKGTTVTYTLSLGTHPTKVPPIVGQPKSEAQSALQSAHLNPVFQPVDSDQPKGTVVSTDPPAGTKVARDSDVTVSISRGPQKVPNVVGRTQAEAEQMIKDRGFTPQVSPDNSSTETQGTVTGQTPAAGATLPQGSTVFIQVSTYNPTSPPTSPPSSEPTSPPTSLPTSPQT